MILIVSVISVVSLYGYNYYKNNQNMKLAIKSCQDLYLSKIDDFESLTGITSLNVEFVQPAEVTTARNIVLLNWDKSIDVAGQEDSFKCQFNFVTNKAINRSSNV